MTYKILGSVRLSEVWLGYVSESSKVVGLRVRIPVKKYSFFSCLKKCEFYLLCRTTPSFLPFFYFLPHLFCGSESIRREREKLLSIGCGGIENWHCSLMWTSPNEARPLDPNDIHHLDDFLAIQSYPTNPKCSHLLSIKKFLLLKTP